MARALIVLILASVLAGGGYYCSRAGSQTPGSYALADTEEIRRGPITASIAATGRVVSNLDVEIKSKASGQIIKIHHDVSERVQSGDLLIEFDPTDEQRNVTQAECTLAASQAKLAQMQEALRVAERNLATERKRANACLRSAQTLARNAQTKLQRLKNLVERSFATQEDSDAAESAAAQAATDLEAAQIRLEELQNEEAGWELKRQEIQAAKANADKDRAALADAQQRLKDTRVFAPIDGVVAARYVQVGQIVSSGISNVGGGTAMLILSDLSRIFVLASVDESEIGKVQLAQETAITVDSFPAVRMRGEVVQIAVRGVNVSNVVTFEVRLEVKDDRKSLLKPEMTANVEIITARRDNVVVMSNDAIIRKDAGPHVLVLGADGTALSRPVELGLSDDRRSEVVSGLCEGERVVVSKFASKTESSTSSKGMPPPPMP